MGQKHESSVRRSVGSFLLDCPAHPTLPPMRKGDLATNTLISCATYTWANIVRPNTRYYASLLRG
jgi:hypothetical protein